MRRQLPLVAERLSQTLERLQRPQEADAEASVAASQWWEALARQYQGEAVEFGPALLAPGARLPRGLFDSVADNLIRNALAKRRDEPQISVRVSMDENGLRVCDSGSAVPPQVVAGLLRGPVASTTGLGIGLYQAARQAEASGYRLVLAKNEPGEVCFALLVEQRDYGSMPAAISLP
jgi:signal transduction histidine kinase